MFTMETFNNLLDNSHFIIYSINYSGHIIDLNFCMIVIYFPSVK